jgi:uncharacterized protein
MKIGLVSDIHADARSLRRALEHLPSVDAYLCPGDAVSEYRFCAETVEVLQQANVLCIQGNHEQVLFNGRNPIATHDSDLLSIADLRVYRPQDIP